MIKLKYGDVFKGCHKDLTDTSDTKSWRSLTSSLKSELQFNRRGGNKILIKETLKYVDRRNLQESVYTCVIYKRRHSIDREQGSQQRMYWTEIQISSRTKEETNVKFNNHKELTGV